MDTALRHRVNAARVILAGQADFFLKQLGNVDSQWKADDSRVTFADFAISERVLTALRREFPQDEAYSEESALETKVPLTAKYTWILDPIDGTNNFALGMRTCSIALGLLKNGIPHYGLILDGSSGEWIEGGPQQPLRVNGKLWSVPQRKFHPRTSVVGVHFPLPSGRAATLRDLLENYRLRSLGSSALHLAYVALGKIDGAIDEQVKIWDIAASLALVAASGHRVRFLSTSPLPLRSFALDAPRIRYYCGSPAFMDAMDNWLGEIT